MKYTIEEIKKYDEFLNIEINYLDIDNITVQEFINRMEQLAATEETVLQYKYMQTNLFQKFDEWGGGGPKVHLNKNI